MAAEIPLTQGKTALVDEADAPIIGEHQWRAVHLHGKWYAARGQWPVIYMHKQILSVREGLTVDHVNGDGLDNRRENLRPATMRQQAWNRAPGHGNPFKGVYWQRDARRRAGGRWICTIDTSAGRITRRAPTEIKAAGIYNILAREHFGDFAWLNPVPEGID